ncbi:MAG: hypothetical protein RML36_01665 [Anaerolineae bacterium]|nr:hypothetical protein [Anaerolineae bacterium]MDW8098174.1 hypothetical protein [Anaerolineae bacterium]
MTAGETEQSDLPQPQLPLPPVEGVEQPQDESQEIQKAARALSELLQREPEAVQVVERVIGEHLRGGINTDTGGILFDSLAFYVGEELANFLLTLLARAGDDRALLAQVEAHLSVKVKAWLRSLLALYGSALREAYTIGGENPHSWRTINRQVYYDLMSDRWRITLEVIKYNGERTTYVEEPNTLLILADAILDTLNRVPAEVAPEVVKSSRLDSFINTCLKFFQLYAPGVFGQGGANGTESPES